MFSVEELARLRAFRRSPELLYRSDRSTYTGNRK